MSEQSQVDEITTIATELYRSYILAGRKKDAPQFADLTEQAGAIIQQNNREAYKIPAKSWQDVFQYARKSWGTPGWSELIKAWSCDGYTTWMSAKREAVERNKPKTVLLIPTAEESAKSWDDAWLEAHKRGEWVPTFVLVDLKAKGLIVG